VSAPDGLPGLVSDGLLLGCVGPGLESEFDGLETAALGAPEFAPDGYATALDEAEAGFDEFDEIVIEFDVAVAAVLDEFDEQHEDEFDEFVLELGASAEFVAVEAAV